MTQFMERYKDAWSEDSLRFIRTPSPFAKSSLFYVQEIGHFQTQPSYFTEREQLDSFLMVYTLRGLGRLNYQQRSLTVHANQLFFIDCMQYHHYRTDNENPWELLWVHFNGSTTRGYYDKFAEAGNPILTLQPETSIPSLIKQLIHYQQPSLYSELKCSMLLVELMTDCLLEQKQAIGTALSEADYIYAVIEDIKLNYKSKITLDELSKQHAVSKSHLSKQFKRMTGFSPNEYLINIRITHAKELLKYTDLPVAQIAAEVGIENVSHFINLFKDRVEYTPLLFRKKWQR
ncbi:AraC family transcriptional regulator [Paenibacillus sp. YYML68]|uniref:helix-turn-helix domain-containing protein n=1 Tax=Paenibacillus sp. YYML68 TaxID=2909250 RepID=UPI0024939D4F|nr:AraC family transcriptional regulator [Paenibacillus sp. YYML68]